jgi:uncharacterized membrane protein YebE (DUF533 family)
MQTPSGDVFGDRRKALEDSFFHERDQLLLEKLRLELETMEAHKHLAHVSGIVDQQVLLNLVKAGVRAETLAAITLIPLVEVAWADGAVADDERAAVLKGAAENGVTPGTAAHGLLEHWLRQRPDMRIIAAWKEYVHTLAKTMPPEAVATMRDTMIQRARRVAEAAGGFLNITSKISKVEQAALEEFERAATP